MRTYIFLLTLIMLLSLQTQAAGIFDSLTGGSKKKQKKNKTKSEKRAEIEDIAKEAMVDKKIKDSKDSYGRETKKSKSKKKSKYEDEDDEIENGSKWFSFFQNNPLPDEDQWQLEWDKAMHNFFPEDQMKFILPAKSSQVWYIDIESEDSVHVRGAYQVNQGMEGNRDYFRIHVLVMDPSGDVIFKKSGMDIGLIAFDTTNSGKYTFMFSSKNLPGSDREVLFMLHEDYLESPNPDITYGDDYQYKDHHEQMAEEKVSNSAKKVEEPKITEEQAAILSDQLEDEDTKTMKKTMKGTLDELRMMSREAKMSLDNQLVHNDEVNVNFTFHIWVLVIEILTVLLIAVFYVWNIQKMLDNKLIL